jgi:hypothetical protein
MRYNSADYNRKSLKVGRENKGENNANADDDCEMNNLMI